jgi:hypothetical protein
LGDAAGWTNDTELSAVQVDLLQLVLRALHSMFAENPPRDEIQPVPRPFKVAERDATVQETPLANLAGLMEV